MKEKEEKFFFSVYKKTEGGIATEGCLIRREIVAVQRQS
jgi:hypothetical protein